MAAGSNGIDLGLRAVYDQVSAWGADVAGTIHEIMTDDEGRLLRGEQMTAITTTQDLSAGALDFTTSIAADFRLVYMGVSFDQLVTETFSMYLDSAQGANYDSLMFQWNILNGRYIWLSETEMDFVLNDEINVQCTNNGGAGNVYVTILTALR